MDWLTVRYDPTYPEKLDQEIIPLCDALNSAGFVTTQSCCGHGYDWPRVWFEHSSDARIESLARFIMRLEQVEDRPHFSVWRKQVQPEGFEWSLEIHLTDVFADTPPADHLSKAVEAMNRVGRMIGLYARSCSDKIGGEDS